MKSRWNWAPKALLFCGLALLAGCATDSIPDDGNDRTNPDSCPTVCSAGQTRCTGNQVEECGVEADGCMRWTVSETCTGDDYCDNSAEPAVCLSEPGTCDDGVANQDESDVDCGGNRCDGCEIGGTCEEADDCASGNCDLGVTDACVHPDTPTCTDGALNQDETDVDCGGAACAPCAADAMCASDTDCASGTCDAGTCAEGQTSCNDGEVRCLGNTVQTCETGSWAETQICAQMCAAGACSDDVQCTAGVTRCFKNSVQQCNVTGTAWHHLDICNDDCDQGLCVGACEPNALRCNGNLQEACGADGQTWTAQENCTLGCDQRVCIEDKLENKGVPMTLTGTHVYAGCVTVELGGSIDVPEGETLEIWAECLTVTPSSSVNVGDGGTFIFHAKDSITNQGSITGGDHIRLDAYKTLTNEGDVSAYRVELRGDALTNGATGTIGGSYTAALHGSSWTNDGTHDGLVSVMPPESITSPTHPEGFQWNMKDDDVSLAWNKPFASVKGYYVALNSGDLPSPSNGEFTTSENLTLSLTSFRPGLNEVAIVSVNDDSTVGTVTANFEIDFNVKPPLVSSSSHPDSTEWSPNNDVFIEWADEDSLDPESYVGYWYAWDHRGDTVPNEVDGTFRNDDKILLNDQAPGVWNFHIVNIDRLGRTSPAPARFTVRVGPNPGYANIAGTVTDANGDPVSGASVSLNGGIYRTATTPTGDYTFRNVVPAAAFDWELVIDAPGYQAFTQNVRLQPDQAQVIDAQLSNDNSDPVYELGYLVILSNGYVGDRQRPDVSFGRPGELIWSDDNGAGISTDTGTVLRSIPMSTRYDAPIDVGWAGDTYFALATGSNYYGTAQFFDANHDLLGNGTIYGGSYMYGPSMVWDGNDFLAIGENGANFQLIALDPEDPASGEAVTLFQSGGSSGARSAAIYDGSAVALATNGYRASRYEVNFSRWSRNGAEVLAPVGLGEARYNAPIGLAHDGSSYHVVYKGGESNNNGEYPLILQEVTSTGTVGRVTELGRDPNSYTGPSVAFDGRNLLLAYIARGVGYVEVRDPATYAIVDTFSLGEVRNLALDFASHAGGAAVAYSPIGGSGLYYRRLSVH